MIYVFNGEKARISNSKLEFTTFVELSATLRGENRAKYHLIDHFIIDSFSSRFSKISI